MRDDRLEQGHAFALYDCFATTRFGGNVGGVVLDAGGLSEAEMQGLARDINAGVTGFVTDMSQDGSALEVRFFMPKVEIAMCGHVTLGLFVHLARDGAAGPQHFTMGTRAGPVAVEVDPGSDGGPTVMMDMGAPERKDVTFETGALMAALGVSEAALTGPAPEVWSTGLLHLCVQLDSAEAVAALSPDFGTMAAFLSAHGLHTIAVFAPRAARCEETLRLVVRDFCPALGVDEAPASGTTNAALAGYLNACGLMPSGGRVIAEQGAEVGRPSVILSRVRMADGRIAGVAVGGQAVPVIFGRIPAL